MPDTGNAVTRVRYATRQLVEALETLENLDAECTAVFSEADLDSYFFQKNEDGNFILDGDGNKIQRTDIAMSKAEFGQCRSSVRAVWTFIRDNYHTTNFYKAAA